MQRTYTFPVLLTLIGTLCALSSPVSADTLGLTRGFVRLDYENDFFNATDRYYTQGVKLTLSDPLFGRSPLKYVLPKFRHGMRTNTMFVMQECFTPSSIRRDTVFTGDRPFAACLYIGQQMISYDTAGTQRLSSSLVLGVLGPRAGGMETQVSIHKWLDNIEPLGWQYQVSNDIVINLDTKYEKLLVQRRSMELSAGAGLRAGTLYNTIGAGATFAAGRLDPVFNPYMKSIHKKFRCYALLWMKADAVAYNATLQGGLFNKSSIYTISSNHVQRMMAAGGVRGVIAYGRVQLEYSRTWTTSEFRGGLPHGWGGINVQVSY